MDDFQIAGTRKRRRRELGVDGDPPGRFRTPLQLAPHWIAVPHLSRNKRKAALVWIDLNFGGNPEENRCFLDDMYKFGHYYLLYTMRTCFRFMCAEVNQDAPMYNEIMVCRKHLFSQRLVYQREILGPSQ